MSDTTPKLHAPKGPLKARDHTDAPTTWTTCKATAKGSGVRCKRRPIPGGSVCVKHGGGAPQVQRSAQERLLAMQAPALSRLSSLMEQEDFPSVAYQATKDVLDRTMGKPAESVNMKLTGEISIVDRLQAARKRLAKREG